MRRAPDAGRRHIDFAGIGLGVGDEVGNRLGRNRRVHHYDEGTSKDARYGLNVANEIEIEFVVERRVGRLRRTDNEQRVSVRGCAHDRLGGDIGATTRPVLDDKRLAKPLREPSTDQACHGVECAAWSSGNNDAHRPRRIGLRPRDARYGRQRGRARGQMQKISTGKFHGVYVCSPFGRRTINTEPLPSSLATVTSPPIMRASLRVMARPSPVPPKFCAVVASAWVNSSNSFACCSAVMPMPVSETANSTKLLPLLTLRAASLTSPSLVNLHALLNRLSSICRSRMGSTVSAPRFS